LLDKLQVPSAYFVPVSALLGDNIVESSGRTPWFQGPCLLEHLETVDIPTVSGSAPFRFPVQRVVRPDDSFRGYAGQVVAGSIRPGDPVHVLPAGRRTQVRSITTFDGDFPVAHAPMSVTLTLCDEIDISRGDMIAAASPLPEAVRHLEATVVWMHADALETHKPYLIKHTTQTVRAEIKSIRYRVNVERLDREKAAGLELNAIGVVEIETARPLFFDAYTDNRSTGSIIIIDPSNNLTVGAGMISRPVTRERVRTGHAGENEAIGRVTRGERLARYRHSGAIVAVGPRPALAELIERTLFDRGCAVVIVDSEDAACVLQYAGLIAVLQAGPEITLPADEQEAATYLIGLLEHDGVLPADSRAVSEEI
jgi:sulfate adenylyltransferase subunit 1